MQGNVYSPMQIWCPRDSWDIHRKQVGPLAHVDHSPNTEIIGPPACDHLVERFDSGACQDSLACVDSACQLFPECLGLLIPQPVLFCCREADLVAACADALRQQPFCALPQHPFGDAAEQFVV